MAGEPSLLDVGGIVGGALAAATTVGAGIRWLFSRADRRAAALDRKEADMAAKIEARVGALEGETKELRARHEELKLHVDTWRVAFKFVADDLAAINPISQGLARARLILSRSFPNDPFVPPDMQALLDQIL